MTDAQRADSATPSTSHHGTASDIVIIGAGPAGLTAAYELTKRGLASTVVEADSTVGGISRTVERDGWRFDIGGHRFFTKVEEVQHLWHEILAGEEFLLRPRMSRIFYEGRYYDYPLKASNALSNLGIIEALRCVLSYVWVRIRPPKDQSTFEGWVAARFGWRLYRTFFKTYTEKVWGVPATEIQADWAAQRIKNLSLFKAILNSLTPSRNQTDITSLIEEFEYPKYGPGMMWERCRDLVEAQGTKVVMNSPVTRVNVADGRATSVVTDHGGAATEYPADHIISSMPLPLLLKAIEPAVPDHVREAADDLNFRDFLTVALVVPDDIGFPDNWIYVHSPEVEVGRIQNYGSWSPYLVKDGRTCLGLEYFVFEGDELWAAPDDQLVELATKELALLGLASPSDVQNGYVVRMPKAYPTYDEHYKRNVEILRHWLAENAANVHPVGRNGMHKYNNQDHSMYTAMLTVENILGAHHDIWAVNVEEEYHEEGDGAHRPQGTGRDAPIVPRAAQQARSAG
ncbi:MAG: putative thiazole biosynthetic enzyme [Acidimicrobiales bacterium]|nr:MAG: NAD(P)/FAD-dependent oxidoreductase [Actinomycetota bacterium]MBV6508268.1 putative thiazole biosynthetic enzyme [Acidimicrobiales bacterium]RIK07357.1 MAG: FAD-dependent oxidoreductase [Acidobacteriota bacterium]